MKAAHLADKKQSGLVVAPITVIKVTRNNKEGDPLLNSKSNELIKSLTCGGANAFRRSSFLSGKPFQRTVQMNVRGMKKAKRRHGIILLEVG